MEVIFTEGPKLDPGGTASFGVSWWHFVGTLLLRGVSHSPAQPCFSSERWHKKSPEGRSDAEHPSPTAPLSRTL